MTQTSEEEKDSYMNFIIVGGGPTGVELAGALAELKKHVLPKDFPDLDIRRMQIHLVEASSKVLAAMSDKASDHGLEYLKKIGVNIWTDTFVNDYDGHTVETSKEVFKAKTLIWAAGVMGNVPDGVPAEHVDRSRIVVDEYNQVKGLDGVYAIGDVSVMKTEENPHGLPMLGSVAQQQGQYLAKSLKRLIKNKSVQPFKYVDKGTMATVGRNLAVVDLGKVHFGGWFAWLTWLLVHLMLLVDFKSRVSVFVTWVWNYINFDRGTRLIVNKFSKKEKEEEELEELVEA